MLLVTIGWVVIVVSGKNTSLKVILPVILCLLYLAFYTPEWIQSSTWKFLSNQKQESNLFHYVEALRQTKPSLHFHVSCWHNEKRTKQVNKTDSNGNSYTATETETVKVVTHTRVPPSLLQLLCWIVAATCAGALCIVMAHLLRLHSGMFCAPCCSEQRNNSTTELICQKRQKL